jgi:hypothetical protein
MQEEEFISAMNLLHNLQNLQIGEKSKYPMVPFKSTSQFHDSHNTNMQKDQQGDSDFDEQPSIRICTYEVARPRRRAIKLC